MSGSKQHFIPQSLLKGFGIKQGKSTRVIAYTYDRGIFPTGTMGIGAERHFYSELGVEGEHETLDDLITDYEQSFQEILMSLRTISDGHNADTKMAAEFVTHLAVRNDHFRKSVATAGANLMEGMADALSDQETAKAMLGLSGSQPSELFESEVSKLWPQFQPIAKTMGISKVQFHTLAFQTAKANFASFHSEISNPLSEMFGGLVRQLPDVAASSQRRSLAQGLSPPLRVEKLSEFSWRVICPEEALVLPDCVSVAFDTTGGALPLMLANMESIESVLMPLSSDRLLIGTRQREFAPPPNLLEAFASCSWDFFVARNYTDLLEMARSLLRSQVITFLDKTVDEVLNDATTGRTGSGQV
jgi:Protein of unknown function (DUF4238)